MKGTEESHLMWDELQQFVQKVEEEKKKPGDAKPYIDQIREILSKNMTHASSLKVD